MKRLLALLALSASISSPLAATAQQEGPYTYTVTNGNATITVYDSTNENVVLDIPDTLGVYPVTAIDEGVFSYAGLSSVSIPASVTNIGDEPFRGCAITAFTVDSNNPAFSSEDGILFNNPPTTLIRYPGLRAGSYTIPSNVTTIAGGAFGRCNGLTGVTIHAGVTIIGGRAFGFSPDILAITVDSNNPAFSSSAEGVLFNKNKSELIQYPEARSGSYSIPDGVTSSPSMSFAESHNLTAVTIPSSLTYIQWGMFISCYSLTSVTIPTNVTVMNAMVFQNCISLARVYFLGNAPATSDNSMFSYSSEYSYISNNVTVYRLAGATGFGTIGDLWQLRPTVLWNGVSDNTWNYGLVLLDASWRRLTWFGDYVPMGSDGWIWHNKQGFWYPAPSSTQQNIWFYAQDMGWLYTSSTLYPFLYRASDSAWLWYNGATNPRWFRNMTAGTWEQRP